MPPRLLLVLAFASAAVLRPAPVVTPLISKYPLRFEQSLGRGGTDVRYLARARGYSLLLADHELRLSVPGQQTSPAIHFAGMSATSSLEALNLLPTVVNDYTGPSSQWVSGARCWSRIRYNKIQPGIDLEFYGQGDKLEYDVTIAPGSHPSTVAFVLDVGLTAGIDGASGDLSISMPGGALMWRRPVAYQDIDGRRRPVAASFVIDGQRVSFHVGSWNRRYPLVIDPTLSYSTLLGGAKSDVARAIAVDANGNAYIAGGTNSGDLPVTGSSNQPNYRGGDATGGPGDAFIAKVNSTGTGLSYITYLGGTGSDTATAIAVDGSGNAFVAGSTDSTDFAITPGVLQGTFGGDGGNTFVPRVGDAFVAKFDATGKLVWSTYLGGSADDGASAIALDSNGNIFITGATLSSNFPGMRGTYQTHYGGAGGQPTIAQTGYPSFDTGDAFVAKIDSTGQHLLAATYVGGSLDDCATALALDSQGNVWIGGSTISADFPFTSGALQKVFRGMSDNNTQLIFKMGDGFVTELSADLTTLLYSTYLGGSRDDAVGAITVDSSGAVYVAGVTQSMDFPATPGTVSTTYHGPATHPTLHGFLMGDAFVAKFIPASGMVFATYVGGSDDDAAVAIAVDAQGNITIAGMTNSSDFPVTSDPLQRTFGGSSARTDVGVGDGFITQVSATGTLLYSTYFGGSDLDAFLALAKDANGNIYAAGFSASPNFRTTSGVLQPALKGGEAGDAVIAKFSFGSPTTPITIQTNPTGLQFTVDGGTPQTAPQTLNLSQGSHTIAAVTPQAGPAGTQYAFASWNDSGPVSHNIVVGTTAATYTASFTPRYQLTISASPPNGGSVTPQTGGFYDSASVVPITATPANGFQFSNWTGGTVASATSASTTVTMSAPETVVANFSALAGITIQTSPAGLQFTVDNGTPQTAPQTLNLSQGTHTIAVVTTQQGTPGTQYVFTGWNDNSAASRTITVTSAAATYTASFKTQYQLTASVLPANSGSVTPNNGFFDFNSVVPITATAATGFQFSNWTGSTIANAANASTTVTMSGPETIVANFTPLAGITIQTNPTGLQFTVDNGPPQMAPQTLSLASGNHTIAVAATQQGTGTQYLFTGWADGAGTASRTINVTSASATYTANFKTQYQLNVSASPANGGAVTPMTGLFYDSGANVPIAATANSGFQFTNWTGATVASATSASTSITMSGPQTVVANFSPIGGGITIQTSPPGLQFSIDSGAPQTAPQTLNLSGGNHTLTVATQQSGPPGTRYQFVAWNDNGAPSHTITVQGSATYTATFNPQYQLTISPSPLAGGFVTPPTGGFYNAGVSVQVTASASSGYQFTGWTGPTGSATSPVTAVTMNQPQTVVANFAPITFTLNPTSANYSASGGTGVVTVTASSPGASWSAASNDSFITIAAGAGGIGNGTLNYTVAANSGNARQGTITIGGQTFTVTQAGALQLTALRFLPLTPCRVLDTRNPNGSFGGPMMSASTSRDIPISQSPCNIPANAQAYSLNVTVVPPGPLTYLSIWPAGQAQPVVSTLNSFDGRVVANAAIVPAGSNGSISVFVSNASHVIIDINGVFVPAATANTQSFYPVTPCRVADTRGGAFTGAFGGPFMSAGSTRTFLIPSGRCGIPNTAQAYSLNVTVVPHTGLQYLTVWPTGQSQPLVSTLNAFDGSIVANAAIVPAGSQGSISVFVTNDTDVILDINGYFAPPGSPGAESLYTVTPCRVVDTRGGFNAPFGPPNLTGGQLRDFPIPTGACPGIPPAAQAYSLNATVVPIGSSLGFLSAWPTGQAQPLVSTLNSPQGKVVANAAIVPAGQNGAVSIFVTDPTNLILDINAFFAP